MFSKENSSTISLKGKKGKDVPLRKSDRRNLRKRVQDILLNAEEEDETAKILDAAFLQGTLMSRNLVLPSYKATLYFRSPADEVSDAWPYRLSSQCVWIELDEGPHTAVRQVPSVALLSVFPLNSIPTLSVPSRVSKFICRGAHLMKAGMFSLPDPLPSSESSRIVGVCVQGNPQPFAVGILSNEIQSLADIGPGTKGEGVHIVTTYGDDLWQQQTVSPLLANTSATMSPTGGTLYDAGHYGNDGFRYGKVVLPLASSESQGAEEEPKEEESDQPVEGPEMPPSDSNPTGGEQAHEDKINEEKKEAAEDSHSATEEPPLEDEEEADAEPTPEEVLHMAVCKALAKIHPKKDLPMTVARFYAQYVLPSRPEGTTIQLKQTKWKKFGVYVREQVDNGLLAVGPDASKKDPMAMLVNYDTRHPDLREFIKEEKAKPKSEREPSANRLLLVELYIIPHHFQSLLRLDMDAVKAVNATSPERRNTGMLTAKEMRSILDDYIAREGLVDQSRPQKICLDGPLTDALFKKKKDSSEKPQERLSRKDVVKAWQGKMETAYALVETPDNRIVKLGRGKPPQVSIEVSRRQTKKFVTRVRGLEDYGIDPELFCKDVCHRLACSGSVEENPEGRAALRKGHVELVFQGNLADELEALLLGDESLTHHGGVKGSEYHLPKNSIEVILRKGVSARKKQQAPSKKKK